VKHTDGADCMLPLAHVHWLVPAVAHRVLQLV
jgi:hypothetical protein